MTNKIEGSIKNKKSMVLITTVIGISILFTGCSDTNENSDVEKMLENPSEQQSQSSTIDYTGSDEKICENVTEEVYDAKFNQVESLIAICKSEPEGYFWEDINQENIKKILPTLSEKHDIEGRVEYTSKDDKASIYNIGFRFNDMGDIPDKSWGGVSIQIDKKPIERFYDFAEEEKVSDIIGIPVILGVFESHNKEDATMYFAEFQKDDLYYMVEYISDKENADELFSYMLLDILLDETPNLSILENPEIPKLSKEELSLKEAYSDADFGKYLIKAPDNYVFDSAKRYINQEENGLSVLWIYDYDDFAVNVKKFSDKEYEDEAIIKIEDLKPDFIKKLSYTNEGKVHFRFGVLYGDVLVDINCSGDKNMAKHLYDELIKVKDR